MITFTLRNMKTGQVFEKTFDSPYQAHLFKCKCRFSRKVYIISVSASTYAAYEALKSYGA